MVSLFLWLGVSKNNGTPKWMVYFMEYPMNKWDDLGGGVKRHYFWVDTYVDHHRYLFVGV